MCTRPATSLFKTLEGTVRNQLPKPSDKNPDESFRAIAKLCQELLSKSQDVQEEILGTDRENNLLNFEFLSWVKQIIPADATHEKLDDTLLFLCQRIKTQTEAALDDRTFSPLSYAMTCKALICLAELDPTQAPACESLTQRMSQHRGSQIFSSDLSITSSTCSVNTVGSTAELSVVELGEDAEVSAVKTKVDLKKLDKLFKKVRDKLPKEAPSTFKFADTFDFTEPTCKLFEALLAAPDVAAHQLHREYPASAPIIELQFLALTLKDTRIQTLILEALYGYITTHKDTGSKDLTKEMRDTLQKNKKAEAHQRYAQVAQQAAQTRLVFQDAELRKVSLKSIRTENIDAFEYHILNSANPTQAASDVLKDIAEILAESPLDSVRPVLILLQEKLQEIQPVLVPLQAKLQRTSQTCLARQQAAIQVMQNYTSLGALTENIAALTGQKVNLEQAHQTIMQSPLGQAFTAFQKTILSIHQDTLNLGTLFEDYDRQQAAIKEQITTATKAFLAACPPGSIDKETAEKMVKLDLVEDESLVAITFTNVMLAQIYGKVQTTLQNEALGGYLTLMRNTFLNPKDVGFGQKVGLLATQAISTESFAKTIPYANGQVSRELLGGRFHSNYMLLGSESMCQACETYTPTVTDATPVSPTRVYRTGTHGVFKAEETNLSHLPPADFQLHLAELDRVKANLKQAIKDEAFWASFRDKALDGIEIDGAGKGAGILQRFMCSDQSARDLSLLNPNHVKLATVLTKYLFSLHRAISHLDVVVAKESQTRPEFKQLHLNRMGAIRVSDKNEKAQLELEILIAQHLHGKTLHLNGRDIALSYSYTDIPHNNGTAEADTKPKILETLAKLNKPGLVILKEKLQFFESKLEHDPLAQRMRDTFTLMERYFTDLPGSSDYGSLLPLAQILQAHLVNLFQQAADQMADLSGDIVYVNEAHCKSGLDRTAVYASQILFCAARGMSPPEIVTFILSSTNESDVLVFPMQPRSFSAYSSSASRDDAATPRPSTFAQHSISSQSASRKDSEQTLTGLSRQESLLTLEMPETFETEKPTRDAFSLFQLRLEKDMDYWEASRLVPASKPNVVGVENDYTFAGIPLIYMLDLGEENAQG